MTAPFGVRFCNSSDGTRLAFSVAGQGPRVLMLCPSSSDNDLDRPGEASIHWVEALSSRFTLIRYDARGCGMSQRGIEALDLERWQEDIDAVLAASGGGAVRMLAMNNAVPVALRYAASRPAAVESLVLYGGYARGRFARPRTERETQELNVALDMLKLAHHSSDEYGVMFRIAFYRQYFPAEDAAFYERMDEVCRKRIPGDAVHAYATAMWNEDASDAARAVRCPTLVVQARGDTYTPSSEGTYLAGLVAGSELFMPESRNNAPLAHEPGWPAICERVLRFLGADDAPQPALTVRQREVLQAVSQGKSDKVIARELQLSPRTVEMHVAGALKTLGCSTRAEAVRRAAEIGLLRG